MTAGDIHGDNIATCLIAAPAFSGANMMVGAATLAVFELRDLTFVANNVAGITTAVNLARTPESSVRNKVVRVRIIEIADGNAGLNMDGSEDSTVDFLESTFHTGGHGSSLVWHVPFGNVNVRNSTMFDKLILEAQNAEISNSTIGAVYSDISTGTGIDSLVLNNVYSYADKASPHANVGTIGSAYIGSLTIMGGFFLPNTQSDVVALQGKYGPGTHALIGATFNGEGLNYALYGATTVASAGNPYFIQTVNLQNGSGQGVPDAAVKVSIPGAISVNATHDVGVTGTQVVSGFVGHDGQLFTPHECTGYGAKGSGGAGGNVVYHATSNITDEATLWQNGAGGPVHSTGQFFIISDTVNVLTGKLTAFGLGAVTITWTAGGGTPTGTFSFTLRCTP